MTFLKLTDLVDPAIEGQELELLKKAGGLAAQLWREFEPDFDEARIPGSFCQSLIHALRDLIYLGSRVVTASALLEVSERFGVECSLLEERQEPKESPRERLLRRAKELLQSLNRRLTEDVDVGEISLSRPEALALTVLLETFSALAEELLRIQGPAQFRGIDSVSTRPSSNGAVSRSPRCSRPSDSWPVTPGLLPAHAVEYLGVRVPHQGPRVSRIRADGLESPLCPPSAHADVLHQRLDWGAGSAEDDRLCLARAILRDALCNPMPPGPWVRAFAGEILSAVDAQFLRVTRVQLYTWLGTLGREWPAPADGGVA